MPDGIPDGSVLEQFLSLQTAMFASGSASEIGNVVCQRLTELPGVDSAGLCIAGKLVAQAGGAALELGDATKACRQRWLESSPGAEACVSCPAAPSPGIECLPLGAGNRSLGGVLLRPTSPKLLGRWRPYLENTANLLALLLERMPGAEDGRNVCDDCPASARISGVPQSVRGITDRRQAEKALRMAQFIVDRAPVGIFRIAEDGKILSVNDHACQSLGYTRDELCGMTVFDIDPLVDRQRWRNHRQALRSTSSRTIESRHRRKDGTTFPVEVTVSRADFEGCEFTVSIVRDMTERCRSQEILRENQRRLTTLMSNLPGMAYRCANDAAWTMEFVSNGCLALTGYEAKDLLDDARVAFGDLILPEHRQEVWAQVQAALAENRPFELVYRIACAGGECKWVWEQGRGVVDEEGNVLALEGFITDVTQHKHAQEDAARSTAMLNETGMIGRIGGWEHDLISGRASWTKALYDIVEIAEGEPIPGVGEHLDYYEPEDRARLAEAYEHAVATGEPFDLELRIHTAKGKPFWARAIGRPVYEGGRCVKMQGTFQDITERKQVEEELRYQRDTAQTYLDVAGVMFVALDRNADVTLINQKGCTILGCTEEDIVGKNWFQNFVPQRLRAEVTAAFERLTAGTLESVEYFENPIRTRDGKERLIAWHNTILKDSSGQITGTLSSGEDITERKQAEETVEAFFDQSLVMLFIADMRTERLLRVNHEVCRITGRSEEELCSVPFVEFVHPDDREASRQAIATLADGRPLIGFVNRHITAAGEARLFEWTGVPDMERHLLYAMAQDITERKQAEKERRELEAQLRQAQKMEAVGQLAGGVAHDFNNILTTILGNTELSLDALKLGAPPDDPTLLGLQEVERAAQRAARLTRQLLIFSRRDVTKPDVVDLNQTISEMEKMLRRLITENISLEFALDTTLPKVYVDAGQIEQVIMNLTVNARDAMPDGGKLVIETARAVLDQAYVAKHAEARLGPYVLLAVSDTGCGIDAQTAERIFEPFFTTKPVGHGTGLGLATVYAIVKQAGGHVMVYSEPQQGTTFKIYIPVAETARRRAEPRVAEAPLIGGSETVLICEDDETVRQLAAHILKDAGYTVLSASGGGQAIQVAATHHDPIHLLVTDVVMPDINGRKLSDVLTAARPGIRTLFVSGYTSNIIAHHGVLDEGVEFLEKPFSRQSFLMRVREVLDKPVHTPG